MSWIQTHCDVCGKLRSCEPKVIAGSDPEAPDEIAVCFVCQVENGRRQQAPEGLDDEALEDHDPGEYVV